MTFSKLTLFTWLICLLASGGCDDPEILKSIFEHFGDQEIGNDDVEKEEPVDSGTCEGTEVNESEVDGRDIFSSGAVIKIISLGSGKSLDINGQSTQNGANLSQWDYWEGANQKWIFRNRMEGVYEIVNLNSGKCLDVIGGSENNGANVLQWDCWGGDNQLWKIEEPDEGVFEIKNLKSGKCLDVKDGNPDNGANIFQWDCWGGDYQKWIMEAIHVEAEDTTRYECGVFDPYAHYKYRTPLSTSGRFIVDRLGIRVKLVSVNWYGASDAYHVVGGLDKSTPGEIASLIEKMGFNSVRLPFSSEMLGTKSVEEHALAANPDLVGLSAIEIFDTVVEALTDRGLFVILNNHTTTGKWCCNYDENALWFTDEYTPLDWMQDWEFVVDRYSENSLVVAADIRNEPRAGVFGKPNWGEKDKRDFHLAATTLGNRLHHINENLLIVVEGLDYAQDLQGVADLPVVLDISNKVVYSPHNYPFFRGDNGPYDIVPYEYMKEDLDRTWGYILDEENPASAPVWISEFGIGINDKNTGEKWFLNIVRYLKEKDIDWAWWPLNVGNKPNTNDPETWGLLTDDWKEPLLDWRTQRLKQIQKVVLGPGFNMKCSDEKVKDCN